ncbi:MULTISPECIES: SDR family NAD(P)-dependent oxidoreductase [unclassified Xanthobacter]|uniref:SDR family NAD(P)-dependent oxidoreductase n=1 Tax=unclassified Xanthobacter TaxID=2623496 RepID=UPI001EE09288|nr:MULTISPECIES: SDR family oxidoreductase [unclassified Xanthobacter]
MKIDLTGKRAIVTGSTLGIGFAIAKGLAAAGAEVVVNGRKAEAVAAAVEALKGDGAVRGVVADLGTAEGCATLVKAVPQADILVNNVGIYTPDDFFEAGDEVWQRYFDINVMSGVRLARAYLPGMAAKGWGRVVFLSSESGVAIPADMIPYGFSKTAAISIAHGLAKRMAGTGVTVNSVLPGPTFTEGVADMVRAEAEKQGVALKDAVDAFTRAARPTSIIQRAATPEEVANMVVYVCSKLASATTGAALRVDGGVVDGLV